MAGYGKLPDTPWHVGYTKKDEHDPRRHKARCIHLNGEKCTYGKSGCFMMRCYGSSHCMFYAETEADWEKYLNTMKISGDKPYDKIRLEKVKKQKEVKRILNSDYTKKYRFLSNTRSCPFCAEKLYNLECRYCLAKFKIVNEITMDAVNQARKEGYFLIKQVYVVK